MRTSRPLLAAAALGLALTLALEACGGASRRTGVRPAVFMYGGHDHVGDYAHQNGLVVVTRQGADDPLVKDAAKAGAEVLVYFDLVVAPGTKDLDPGLFGSTTLPAHYRFQHWRADGYGPILDVRAGSAWMRHAVPVMGTFVRSHPWVKGIFLDDYAEVRFDRSWNRARPAERAAFRRGIRYWAPRIRAEVGPKAVLVGNGVFVQPNASLNGTTIEHHTASEARFWRTALGAGWYGGPKQKRTVVIATSGTDARAWAKIRGVTHVSAQCCAADAYVRAPAPPALEPS